MFCVLAGGAIQLRLHCYGLLLGFVGGGGFFLSSYCFNAAVLFVCDNLHSFLFFFLFFLTEYYF